jgi:LCP family protein required for cell wall assembly
VRRGCCGCLSLALFFVLVGIGVLVALAFVPTQPLHILVMGVDRRVEEPARTDTIALASFDPSQRGNYLLSVPRDLWVTYPDGDAGRINEAYERGGPALSARQVSSVLGTDVSRWVLINFAGFKEVVDAMGGVTVDVAQSIDDRTYPADSGFGYKPFHLAAGRQHLDGATTLQYVRSRHDDPEGDIGRARRQQQVLVALKGEMLQPDHWLRLPGVLWALDRAIDSNLSPFDWARSALLLVRADGTIRRDVLDLRRGLVTNMTTSGGAQVLRPDDPAIRALVARLASGEDDPHLTIRVRNGTTVPGLGAKVAATLRAQGFTVESVDNAPDQHVQMTVVEQNPSAGHADQTAARLAAVLHARMLQRDEPTSEFALTVIVGSDAAG